MSSTGRREGEAMCINDTLKELSYYYNNSVRSRAYMTRKEMETLCSLQAEKIADMQFVLDTLPKTRDGVPITLGMQLFAAKPLCRVGKRVIATVFQRRGNEMALVTVFQLETVTARDCKRIEIGVDNGEGYVWFVLPEDCYSTLEAVEAAKEEKR